MRAAWQYEPSAATSDLRARTRARSCQTYEPFRDSVDELTGGRVKTVNESANTTATLACF